MPPADDTRGGRFAPATGDLGERLRELALLYDTAPIGLAFLTPDCRLMQINQQLAAIFGTSAREQFGRSVRETVPQIADEVERIVAGILRTGEPVTGYEMTGQQPDAINANRVWLTNWHPLKAGDGGIIGINVLAEEITERKRVEQEMRARTEALAQRVADQAQERERIWMVSEDLLAVADLGGRFISINPAWMTTLGWGEKDLIGQTSGWLLHPDDRERTRIETEQLAAGRPTQRFENRYRDREGAYHWLSWTAVPADGRIYATARDVTELKQAEQALRGMQRELARAAHLSTMGTMAASIAHEINQPLAAIVTNAQTGLRWLGNAQPDLEEIRAALKRIVDDGRRAAEVITGIRAMFGKESRAKSLINVNELIRGVLGLVQGELTAQKVALHLDLQDPLPAVAAERVQLQQVILNLVTNAIEAMADVTGRERMLAVRTQLDEPHGILVAIEDSGTGIEESNAERIFESFFTTKPSGMGMGLSICRSIVQAHGGRLWASARNPEGSIFHVRLPID